MSEPEIARRCPSCGASIRIRGSFCPQCGNPVEANKASSAARDENPDTEEIVDAPETVSLDLPGAPTLKLTTSHAETHQLASNQAATIPLEAPPTHDDIPVEQAPQRKPTPSEVLYEAAPGPSPEPGNATSNAVGRARAAREAIEGDVLQGVGKLREISTVVLDEASYDPSLRFVLVAVILFVLFVLILILSEVIT